jgi:phosphatidylglycerophosphate synthase
MAIAPLPSSWDGVVLAVTIVAVVLTVYSGLEYFLTTRHRVAAS